MPPSRFSGCARGASSVTSRTVANATPTVYAISTCRRVGGGAGRTDRHVEVRREQRERGPDGAGGVACETDCGGGYRRGPYRYTPPRWGRWRCGRREPRGASRGGQPLTGQTTKENARHYKWSISSAEKGTSSRDGRGIGRAKEARWWLRTSRFGAGSNRVTEVPANAERHVSDVRLRLGPFIKPAAVSRPSSQIRTCSFTQSHRI